MTLAVYFEHAPKLACVSGPLRQPATGRLLTSYWEFSVLALMN